MRSTAGCLILIILLGICANGCRSSWLWPKLVAQISDGLDGDMEQEAYQVTLMALHTYTKDTEIANYIVEEFDRRHGNTWHCIIGGCAYSVTPSLNNFIKFSFGNRTILLFKVG
ncbi:uncharacterized protein [Chanodichthys erythropterus]|uniref:uncharacterized protein n=1 Tax=Chanodichthys erythropterus TaxID=933992 RepID=UPI00351DA979